MRAYRLDSRSRMSQRLTLRSAERPSVLAVGGKRDLERERDRERERERERERGCLELKLDHRSPICGEFLSLSSIYCYTAR